MAARGGASGRGGSVDMQSSRRGGSRRSLSASGGRRMNNLFFIIFNFATRASVMMLFLLSY